MPLADILLAKGLVSQEQIMAGVAHQKENGGRFGAALAATGVISEETIDQVLGEAPAGPKNLLETGIEPVMLLQLMLMGMYLENLETTLQLAVAMQLAPPLVDRLLEEATKRKLVEIMGQVEGSAGVGASMRYALSQAGKSYTQESLEINQYFGPAPVPFEACLRDAVG